MTLSPYNDPDYRTYRAQLRAHPQPCVWCGGLGTEVDHVPSNREHHHVRGTGCCRYLPACRACNGGRGAKLGNRIRIGRQVRSRTW